MEISGDKIDALFSSTTIQQSQRDSLANTNLSRGTEQFQKGNYDGAIRSFKTAISLSPYGDNTIKAYQLLVNAYQKQGKTDEAIKAWKQASSLFPQSDVAHAGLGDIYYSQKDYAAAEKEYRQAVKLNPTDSSNNYSLGQAYMSEGLYVQAATQFKKVIQFKPQDPSGYYALGQVYHKMGNNDEAIDQFQKAIQKKSKFGDAVLELGKTYADMNQMDKANDQVDALKNISTSYSTDLQNYIFEKSDPKFLSVYSLGKFNMFGDPGTSLSAMDSSLASPNSSQTYTMNFIFNKQMDASSVMNIYNWTITKADGSASGGAYNWGLPVQSTDTNISPVPLAVTYSTDTMIATLTFKISQNSTGDGTIDPEHIIFKFAGLDSYGNSMDKSADQYSGVSKIV